MTNFELACAAVEQVGISGIFPEINADSDASSEQPIMRIKIQLNIGCVVNQRTERLVKIMTKTRLIEMIKVQRGEADAHDEMRRVCKAIGLYRK